MKVNIKSSNKKTIRTTSNNKLILSIANINATIFPSLYLHLNDNVLAHKPSGQNWKLQHREHHPFLSLSPHLKNPPVIKKKHVIDKREPVENLWAGSTIRKQRLLRFSFLRPPIISTFHKSFNEAHATSTPTAWKQRPIISDRGWFPSSFPWNCACQPRSCPKYAHVSTTRVDRKEKNGREMFLLPKEARFLSSKPRGRTFCWSRAELCGYVRSVSSGRNGASLRVFRDRWPLRHSLACLFCEPVFFGHR